MRGWSRHRLLGVDAARGIALLGMMATHIIAPVRADGSVSPAFLVAAGRSAALFAVLAGVSFALATRWRSSTSRRRRTRDRIALAVRAGLLMLVGLLLAIPDSGVAVILVYYAAMFVLAIPFLGLSPRALAVWSAATALVVPVVSFLVRPHLPPASYEVPGFGFFDRPAGDWMSELLLTGYYPVLPWMAYLFAGLAVGKLSLRNGIVARRLMYGGAALAIGARALSWLLLYPLGGLDALAEQPARPRGDTPLEQTLTIGLYGTTPTDSWWWLAVASPHASTPLDLATTIGSSLFVLGVFLLLLRRPHTWALPLVSVGGMTLTLYSLHIILLAGPLPRELPHAYAWHVCVAVVVGLLWRQLVGQGPLESATTRLSRAIARAAVPDEDSPHELTRHA